MGKVMSEEKAPSGNKKTMVILVAGLLVVVLALAGAVAYLFLGKKEEGHGGAAPKKASELPVFEKIDTFVVNLAGSGGMLQIEFQAELADGGHAQVLKAYMPKIRSALIMLLSSKTSQELATPEGKAKLKNQIRQVINESVSDSGLSAPVTGVVFTSFIVQNQ